MIAPFQMIIYVTSRLRFQIFLFSDILENISEGYDISKPNGLIENSTYQKQIKRRLKICIKRHIDFLSAGNKMLKTTQIYILVMSAAGAILGVCIIFFLFSFEGSFKKRYPRLVTLVISTGLTFTHAITAGQLMENTLSRLYEILKVIEWHCWNQENKKTLIIFIQHTQQVFQIKFLDTVVVNYQLGISIAKAVYSMISVLSSLKNIEKS
ncbi:uncharacterized protein LOC123014895 [Tribolium madens]|uniref:uncharacterized protein LOC123014895 n=1 Tax=Tribolium madens TaxID=41895 RepID=UPI001CF76345|nr:uncharacterized protein LOC123014895 [Tribolium madens]